MILSGRDLSRQIKEKITLDVADYKKAYGRVPHLVLVLVGNDKSSERYVFSKAADAQEVGMRSSILRLPVSTTEAELLEIIDQLNTDPNVDGIVTQLPLPSHISEGNVIEAIAKEKDVDGFHPMNIVSLWKKETCTEPCTPKGVLHMLEAAGVEIAGKNAVVVGRSQLVGLPMSKMLLDRDATVTNAHSQTRNLKEITSRADILVVAIGHPKFITEDMIAPGAVVIDVGISTDPVTGKLCGDVDFEACKEKASVITPVPGGVGLMTRCCLLENTLECYIANLKQQGKIQ